jgi:hypothetical protein
MSRIEEGNRNPVKLNAIYGRWPPKKKCAKMGDDFVETNNSESDGVSGSQSDA